MLGDQFLWGAILGNIRCANLNQFVGRIEKIAITITAEASLRQNPAYLKMRLRGKMLMNKSQDAKRKTKGGPESLPERKKFEVSKR